MLVLARRRVAAGPHGELQRSKRRRRVRYMTSGAYVLERAVLGADPMTHDRVVGHLAELAAHENEHRGDAEGRAGSSLWVAETHACRTA